MEIGSLYDIIMKGTEESWSRHKIDVADDAKPLQLVDYPFSWRKPTEISQFVLE